ncbi:MAG: diguanylate cyclase [Burkholderiales bacterium]|nr:diguanylate cyclase [Burkholderiales bacterium]
MLKDINARKRTLLVVLVYALLVFGLALYMGLQQRSEAEASERRHLRLIAELTAKRPEQLIEGARQVMFAMSGQVEQLLTDRRLCHDAFRRLQQASESQYHSMGLILPGGELYCNSVKPDEKTDLSDRLYFRLAAASGRFAIGEHQIGRSTRQHGLNFAYPVADAGGKLLAVLYVALDLAKFTEQGAPGEQGSAELMGRVMTILDRNGTVLAQYPGLHARIGEKVPNPMVLQQVLSMNQGIFTALDLDGVKRIYAVESVGSNPDGVAPIRVMVSTPEPMVYAAANRAVLHMSAGAVLVMVLMFVVTWFGVSVLVLRPYRVLLDMADKVRAGDFSARCGLEGGREELARLGAALDAMAEELAARDVQLKQVMRQLNEQAITDQLTGLPNRRYLWGVLEAEVIRARRRQSPLAVMMLDIDHFKEFNDSRGHEAGDLVLKNVAHALRKVVRGSDIVARHGGEEFVIVVPDATEAVAHQRAEALRAEIAELRLTYGGVALEPITLSVGIAISADAHESAEELVRAADDAMYAAKRSGRDCVVFAKERA